MSYTDKIYIGIISYLPSDVSTRSKRIQSHAKEMKRLNELYPDVDIVEINQHYEPSDIKFFDRIGCNGKRNYIHNMSGKLGISGARNFLLKQFYESDKDFIMLMDDDTMIYPYYDSSRFLKDLYDNVSPRSVGIIRPLNPVIQPFKLENYKRRDEIHDFWVLNTSMGIMPGGMIILSNIKKYHGVEIYFDENMRSYEGEGYEDLDFVFQLRRYNIPSHRCSQIITNPLSNDSSVMFAGKDRKALHLQNLKSTYDRYTDIGLEYQILNGKMKTNMSKLSISKRIYVPRSKPYDLEPKLLPKNLPSAESDRLKRKSLI